MTPARLATGYQPDFDIDAVVGRQGELVVTNLITALRDGTVEVKTDERAALTGNVYIEWRCTPRGKYARPSGIAATQADVWAWVLGGSVVVAAPTRVVLEAARGAYATGRRASCTVGSHPTDGVLIPVGDLISRLIEARLT